MKAKIAAIPAQALARKNSGRAFAFFAMNFTASDTAKLTDISLRSINTIHIKLRKKTAAQCEEISRFNGVVKLNESYFGAQPLTACLGRLLADGGMLFLNWRGAAGEIQRASL